MGVNILVNYNGYKFTTENPFEPDEYSAIDLVDDCLSLLKKSCSIACPGKPTFWYKHPKSRKHVEIGGDRQLMIMFKLFQGKSIIEVIVKEGSKMTELMDTYTRWSGDNITDTPFTNRTVEPETILLSNPPETQPSQEPEPLEIHLPETQVPETQPPENNQVPPTGSEGKKTKKKRRPKGLNLLHGSTAFQPQHPSPLSTSSCQPIADLMQHGRSLTSPPLPSPVVGSNQDSLGNNAGSGSNNMHVVLRTEERTSANNMEVDEDGVDNEPDFSDDSWHQPTGEEHLISSDDKEYSDSGCEDEEEDDVEMLDGMKDAGQFSGDEEDGLTPNEKYLQGGVQFEHQLDGTIKLEPRQMFLKKDSFREVMEDYAVQEGIDLHRVANDPWKYTVMCNNLDTCKWRLHASLLADNITFMIKTIKGEHTCSRLSENPAATSKWIMRKIMPELRANKTMNPAAIYQFILSKYGVSVNYMKCFRARKAALKLLDGNHADSYAKLHQYAQIVLERNPGSIVDFQYQEHPNTNPTFSRIFICFNALKEGFLKGCTPFIGVDGCHLKGPYGGVLLSVVAIDGNNGIFPIAFAIVASETTASWTYFFGNLRLMAEEDVRKTWVIISDRQKGVEPALDAVLPEVTRRICCRHLYANFKKDHPGTMLRNLFWEAAQCYTKSAFKEVLKKIEETSHGALRYLRDVDYNQWVRFHMPNDVKVIETTSNFVESFNSKLSNIRGSPIFSLLEELRRTLMKKLNTRREALTKMTGGITPYAKKMLYKYTKAGSRCGHTASSDFEFEVTEANMHFIVNLRDRHCDCMAWDISGIPCKHACSVLNWKRIDKGQFVHAYYSLSKYAETYSRAISPIPDSSIWPEATDIQIVAPPFLKKLPGRPKKHRRREDGEAGPVSQRSKHITCGHCKQLGHNSRTCTSQKNRGDGQGQGKQQEKKKTEKKKIAAPKKRNAQ